MDDDLEPVQNSASASDDDLEPIKDSAPNDDLEPIDDEEKYKLKVTYIPEERSTARKVAEGILQEQPFKEELGAAAEAAFEKLRGNPEKIVELYRRYRDENNQFWKSEREKNGVAGAIAGIAGAIPSGVAMSGVLPGGIGATGSNAIKQGLALGALAGLDNSTSDLTKGEIAGNLKDAAIGSAIGGTAAYVLPKAISALVSPLSSAARVAGKALQLPQEAIEKLAEKIGGSQVVKAINKGKDTALPEDALSSSRVKDLRSIINSADEKFPVSNVESSPLEGKLADAILKGTASADKRGNYSVDPAEFGDAIKALHELAAEDVLAKRRPDLKGTTSDKLQDVGFIEPKAIESEILAVKRADKDKRLADEAIAKSNMKTSNLDEDLPDTNRMRVAPRVAMSDEVRNPSALKSPLRISKRKKSDSWHGRPEEFVGNDADPDVRWERAWKSYGDDEASALERMADEEMGMNRGMYERGSARRMADRIAADDNLFKKLPSKSDLKFNKEFEKSAGDNQSSKIQELIDKLHAKNAEYADIDKSINSATSAKEKELIGKALDIKDAKRGNIIAEAQRYNVKKNAQDKLNRIESGREAIGRLIGATAGGASGGTLGPLGAIAGAALGAKSSSQALLATDIAGALGQKLSSVESLAQKIAKKDTDLGRAARWVLSSDADKKLARLVTFAKLAHDSPELDEAAQRIDS